MILIIATTLQDLIDVHLYDYEHLMCTSYDHQEIDYGDALCFCRYLC